jgi:hypothetical protein
MMCPHACHCVYCAAPQGGPRALGLPGGAQVMARSMLWL